MSHFLPFKPEKQAIWTFLGAKGGVGTSLVVANTAVQLAKKGHRVLAVDLALGKASLHLALGMELPQRNLLPFARREVDTLGAIVVETAVNNLELLAGAPEFPEVNTMNYMVRQLIWKQLRKGPWTIVLVDAGSGAYPAALDSFLQGDVGVLLGTMEPPSLEGLYRTIRALLHRLLRHGLNRRRYEQLRSHINPDNPLDHWTDTPGLVSEEKDNISQLITTTKWGWVCNRARSEGTGQEAADVAGVASRYFDIPIRYFGHVEEDGQVAEDVAEELIISRTHPMTGFSLGTEKLANLIAEGEEGQLGPALPMKPLQECTYYEILRLRAGC